MSGVQNLEVQSDDDGIRIDRWFKRHFPEFGFAQLQKIMRKGDVRLNGKRVKGNERLEVGQIIRVPPLGVRPIIDAVKKPQTMRLSAAELADLQSWVLYKDDDVLVINKPAGLPTQGGTGQTKHLDGMLDMLKFESKYRPRLVHRLDKDTSGALLLGRSPNAAAALAEGFKSRQTDKRYFALVKGVPNPAEGRIQLNMEKAPIKGNERMVVSANGKKSVTDYMVVERALPAAAWLALKPLTGRTHQLRLHCSEMGHPIIGDGKYGGADAFLSGSISKKLHLHSYFISFPHPAGGTVKVTAPLPPHMEASFDMLGFDLREYEDLLGEDV